MEIVKGEELQAFLLSQVTSDFNKRIFINDNNSLDEFLSLSEFVIANTATIKITTAIAIPAINLLSKTHHQIRLFLIKYTNILI